MRNSAGAAWLPWAMTGLALLLRLIRLRHQSLWVDEYFTLGTAGHVAQGNPGFLLKDIHGPLYTACAALFYPFASGETLRLLSAVAGALAVLPLMAWARRVAGDRVAVLAGLWGAMSPFAIWYGQELRNYSFVLLFSACLFLVAERWRGRDPGIWGLIAFVLVAWLGLLSNLTYLLFLIAVGFALLVGNGPRWRRTLLWLSVAAVLILVLSLPWVLAFIAEMAPQRLVVDMPEWKVAPLRGETTFTLPAIPYTFYTLLAGFSLGPSLADLHWGSMAAVREELTTVLLTGLILGGTALWGFWQADRRRKVEWLIIVSVVIGLASILALKNFKVYNVRYVSMLWPLLTLCLAWGALSLGRSLSRRLLVLAVTLLLAASLVQHYWNPAYAKEDCRGAAEHLAALTGAGDFIVVAVVGEPFTLYYQDKYQGEATLGGLWPGQSPREIQRQLEAWGQPPKVWLVSAREWEWGTPAQLLAGFEGYAVRDTASLTGIKVYELHKTP